MNLFINAVSNSWAIILFKENKIININEIVVWWNESSKLPYIIDKYISSNNISYNDLENLIVVSWPWSFTWVRAISLIANTIAFSTKCFLSDVNYFDLFDNYPIVKQSSKRDVFFKKSDKSEIEIMKNEDLLEYISDNKINILYWEVGDFLPNDIKISWFIDYEAIIKKISFKSKKRISPLYIKKPNIS